MPNVLVQTYASHANIAWKRTWALWKGRPESMTGVLNEQCSHFSARQLHILSVRLCSKPDLLACCLFPSYSLLLSPHPSTHLYIVTCMHPSVVSRAFPTFLCQCTHFCFSTWSGRGWWATCFGFKIRVQAVSVKLNYIPGGIPVLWEQDTNKPW